MKLSQLVTAIESVHNSMRAQAAQSVNAALTIRNWLTGFYIFEFEQKGEDRAKYGDHLLETLEDKLVQKQIKGFSETNLGQFRQFYLTYPQISQTASGKLVGSGTEEADGKSVV